MAKAIFRSAHAARIAVGEDWLLICADVHGEGATKGQIEKFEGKRKERMCSSQREGTICDFLALESEAGQIYIRKGLPRELSVSIQLDLTRETSNSGI